MTAYTPKGATVKAAWSELLYLQSHGMKHVDDSGEEFDRFIAKTKADALREAARSVNIDVASTLYLLDRANQIEATAP